VENSNVGRIWGIYKLVLGFGELVLGEWILQSVGCALKKRSKRTPTTSYDHGNLAESGEFWQKKGGQARPRQKKRH
jgi:hypothetical protein